MLEDDPDAAFIAGADAPVTELKAEVVEEPSEKPAEPANGDEAKADEPEAKAEDAPEEPEAPKEEAEGDKRRHPWWQKRIDTLGRGKAAAEDRVTALEQQLTAILASMQPQQQAGEGGDTSQQPQAPKAPAPPAPAPNMTAEQIRTEAQRIVAQETFDRTCNEIYDQGAKAFKGDWQGAVATLGAALPSGITRDLVDAAIEAGDAHKLFYHLGKNPEVAQEIAELPPARMAVRLARIANDLSKPPAPKLVSKAPAPVTPIGAGPTSTDKSPDEMTMDEFIRWDDERQAKRARR